MNRNPPWSISAAATARTSDKDSCFFITCEQERARRSRLSPVIKPVVTKSATGFYSQFYRIGKLWRKFSDQTTSRHALSIRKKSKYYSFDFLFYLYIHANESCPQTFYLNYVLMKNLSIVIGSLTTDARDALVGAIGGAILGSGAGGVEAGPRAVVGELSNGASGSISEAIDKWLN